MFRKKLEEGLSLVFNAKANESVNGEAHLVNEIYYELSRYSVRVHKESSVDFVASVLIEKDTQRDEPSLGSLSIQAANRKNYPEHFELKKISVDETQLFVDQSVRRVAMECIFIIKIQHNECREQLTTLNWE